MTHLRNLPVRLNHILADQFKPKWVERMGI